MRKRLPPRIWVLLAKSAPVAVVLRRGPTRQVQMIKWRLDDDTFEEGQWIKARVYERRCSLSPDGKYLIYFAATYRPPLSSWTAISRPPYFSALLLWPKGDGWNGGGYFTGPKEIHLDHPGSQSDLHPDYRSRAGRFRVGSLAQWRGEDQPMWYEALMRAGWNLPDRGKWNKIGRRGGYLVTAKNPETWARQHRSRRMRLVMEIHGIGQDQGPWYAVRYCVLSDAGELVNELGFVDWAEWAGNGDLLFAGEGRIYRQRRAREKWQSPQMLADLNDNKFQHVSPPAWALA